MASPVALAPRETIYFVKRNIDILGSERFDLLILGGGITGAGVALDATLRGYRVALIDQGDFASGTSSASSKLIHGGLRYLEHAGFRLVYEALHERRLLLENASPYVRPLRFVIPFYQGSRMPAWKARTGLVLYDLLAGSSNLHRSRPLSDKQLQPEFPGLRSEGLLGGAEYFDAQMDDARLCLAVIATAARQGAGVANYVKAVTFEKRHGTIAGVRAHDQIGNSEFLIQARQVLNATGPWVDRVARMAEESLAPAPTLTPALTPTPVLLEAKGAGAIVGAGVRTGVETQPLLQPTKGVHILVAERPNKGALLLLHPADGRVFFVIPWMHKTLIGTTDTLTDESPDSLTVTAAEIAYLLEGFNRYFNPPLHEEDVLGSFAGLRPLMRSRPGQPSSLSREYRVVESPSGLISVAGGKYTTFRRMAEVITDTITRRLGRRAPCQTQTTRLDGALPPGDQAIVKESEDLRQRFQALDEAKAAHLVSRYGSRAHEVAAYVDRDPKSRERIVPGEPDLYGELGYQRDHEMAIRPPDYYLRRTRLALTNRELL
jgi:glycerol-3-phosphate dehydrogenase